MTTNRQPSVRLVRGQSINLTTGVVTEGNQTVNEGIIARKALWISNLIDQNDPSGLAYAIKSQFAPRH